MSLWSRSRRRSDPPWRVRPAPPISPALAAHELRRRAMFGKVHGGVSPVDFDQIRLLPFDPPVQSKVPFNSKSISLQIRVAASLRASSM